jgi:hypothetical protein
MRIDSQCDALPIRLWISRAIADPEEIRLGQFWYKLSPRYGLREHSDFARCVRPSFRSQCGSSTVSNRQAVPSSKNPSERFRSTPSSVFDTRLYSVTGSGHIRRPAALGLLLHYAPLRVSVPPTTNSLQNRQRTPSEFLPVPSEKADLRHLGAGPTPAALPCVTRANSGIQNGEQKCI